MAAEPSPDVRALAARLTRAPSPALARIAFDLALWVGLALVGQGVGHPLAIVACAFVIGFVAQHSLLIHGHEAVHGLVSRDRTVNEVALWLLHALFGTSGTLHRAFHLAHHRWTHEPRDPEYHVVKAISGGAAWGFLVLPAVAPIGLLVWAARRPRNARFWGRLARDAFGIVLLHGALVALLGPSLYATWLGLPVLIGLGPAFMMRSLSEHHGRPSGDPWLRAGALATPRLFAPLWSNIDHHLEHHLFPGVPTAHLPVLRAALAADYARHGVAVEGGFFASIPRRLLAPSHFAPRGSGVC